MAKTFTSNKRLMIQAILGLLLGRVWIFSINPFAIAYFGLALAERKGRGILLAGILLGMASMISGTEYVKYILIMLLMWFMDYLLKKYSDVCWSTLLIGIGSGAIVMIFGITNALLSVDTMNLLIVAVLEGASVVALTNIFQWGIRFLLYENMDKILENEELISLLSLVTLALYGMPHAWEGLFSISATIMYLVVLYVGYRYGASVGAIAGAAGGILASLMGSGAVVIGLYCLLGIGVGMFRQAGRILSCLVFVAMGFALAYTFSQEIVGIVELRGIVSAVIIFLAVPGKMVEKIQVDFESQEENPFAREDIKTIANYKMEDFSGAFGRLAKSFSQYGVKKTKSKSPS